MILTKLYLYSFRSYKEYSLSFSPVTAIIGRNTAGKTNILESIWILATGKSFRTEKDLQMIKFGEEVARIKAYIQDSNREDSLEVLFACGEATGGRVVKKYMVNGVPKRRIDFSGRLPSVLFSPEELNIINGNPALRRAFLDEVLEQVDLNYRRCNTIYEKALRQRNALLGIAKETMRKNIEQFLYWDDILITNGQYITNTRDIFIQYINSTLQNIFSLRIVYDKSEISKSRLAEYTDAELGAGMTLVGPQRDDIKIYHDDQEIKYFGSRGQQRLAVLQLKLLQLLYIEKRLGEKPILLLDDIFSELDSVHMGLVLSMANSQQTIITTTHKEFLDAYRLPSTAMVEL